MKLGELVKGRQGEIIKIKADTMITAAADMMTQNKIGALLVENDSGEIVGILSERDIVRGMGPNGADLKGVAVADLMTADVISCSISDTVNEAMAMMTDRHIRHLPVFEGDQLMGFISIRDLLKCRIMEVQAEAEALRQYILS